MTNLTAPNQDNENESFSVSDSNKSQDRTYSVVLPCDTKDFTKFVSSLLGKPQELRGRIDGVFTLNPQEILNVYHLLNQRINKQNKSTVINFKITVYYNDGHSVEHNNIKDFTEYHPITKCAATGIIISATYLIKFEQSETAEKQDIEVIFATTPEWNSDYRYQSWFSGGSFQYKIKHTERTWAEDISGLLKKHGESIITKQTGIFNWVIKNIDDFTEYLLYITTLISLILVASSVTSKLKHYSSLENPIAIINSLIEITKGAAIILSIIILLLIINKILQQTPYIGERSSILITTYDIENNKKTKSERTRNLIKYFIGWGSGISIGVISNIIYNKNLFW